MSWKWSGHAKDSTHDGIAEWFTANGFDVFETHTMGGGAPDMIAVPQGQALLIEAKGPKTKHTQKQTGEWRGHKVWTIRSTVEAAALANRSKRK